MRITLMVAALLAYPALSAQVYIEQFELMESSGITGPCDSVPTTCSSANIPAETGWTLTGNTSGLENQLDWMKVLSGQLEARDLGEEVCFVSPIVDISNYDELELTLMVSEVGDLESSDYVDVFLEINDSIMLVPTVIGEDSSHTIVGDFPDSADWGDTIVHYAGIQGDSVRIAICIKNNSSDEKIRIDDIILEESLPDSAPGVFISELDCDQMGIDTADFIELAGPDQQDLTGYILVLYNGADDASYAAYDLTGQALNGSGYYTLCFGDQQNTYCDMYVSGSLQNGPDGVGLYYDRNIDEFPNDSPLDTLGLVDGLRYSTSDPIDSGLAPLDLDLDCGQGSCQIDENLDGNSAEVSIQRGSWFLGPPTPGQTNYNPLPVRLLEFKATLVGRTCELRWVTSGEVHNERFEVQRRNDLGDFVPIGIVDGAHFSTELREYYFTDLNVRQSHGDILYRLRIIAEDGSEQFSSIVRVAPQNRSVRVTPTLTNGKINVELGNVPWARIHVYATTGVRVYFKTFEAVSLCRLNLSGLLPATYVIVIETVDGITTEQIVLY